MKKIGGGFIFIVWKVVSRSPSIWISGFTWSDTVILFTYSIFKLVEYDSEYIISFGPWGHRSKSKLGYYVEYHLLPIESEEIKELVEYELYYMTRNILSVLVLEATEVRVNLVIMSSFICYYLY